MQITQLLLLLLVALTSLVSGSVIGLDYGTEWYKVSIVKQGIPLDMVLNKESKRKTPASILLSKREILLGNDAVGQATKQPKNYYPNLKTLLGKKCSTEVPLVSAYKDTFANLLVLSDSSSTCSFLDEETGSVENVVFLVAQQFAHAKKQAEIYGGEKVYAGVLTVPPNFNQFERQAILDAAKVAGLVVLNLINDETAVALNYAMLRKFEDKPQYHIFYDMGAGSTVASLVKFQNVEVPKSPSARKSNYVTPPKYAPQLEVISVGFDATLGGNSIDLIISEMLLEMFVKKHDLDAESVRKDSRSMARLLKEAIRVKMILSANVDTFSSIEGLYKEIDFKSPKITRTQLESLIADNFTKRLLHPIKQVLQESSLLVSDIDSVVLVGGGVRVPIVQQTLKDFVGEGKIAQNVNQDEAAVLGAGFRAAALSTSFRVREIMVKDKCLFPVRVDYATEPKDGKEGRILKTGLFNSNTLLGVKKMMTFKRTSDFTFSVVYKKTDMEIMKVQVTGITTAMQAHSHDSIETKVKVVLSMNENGMVQVHEAFVEVTKSPVVVEKKKVVDSIKDGIMNFFGSKSGGEGDSSEDVVDKIDEEQSSSSSSPKKTTTTTTTSTSESVVATETTNTTTKEEPKEEKPKLITEKIALQFNIIIDTVQQLTDVEITEMINRLKAIQEKEQARQKREETRNKLESLTYSIKEHLYDIEEVSTPTQREEIKILLGTIEDWLYDHGDVATIDEIKGKEDRVYGVWKPIEIRWKEEKGRPDAVDGLRKGIENARGVIDGLMKRNNETKIEEPSKKDKKKKKKKENKPLISLDNLPDVPIPEIETLALKIDDVEKWLVERLDAQKEKSGLDEPVLTVKDLEDKLKEVNMEVMGVVLKKREVPKVEKIVVKDDVKKDDDKKDAQKEDENGQGKVGEGEEPMQDQKKVEEEDNHDEL